MNTPAANAVPPTSASAGSRCRRRWRWAASQTTSNILTREVVPAKRIDRKKSTAKSCPAGIRANTFGRVIKISGGPACGSSPNANTAGITANPDTSAASVSRTAVSAEACGMSSFLER